jgi:rubrerythrin
MNEAHKTVLEILAKAYQIEVDGHTFYSMAAMRSDRTTVREVFEKLAHDEILHKAYLEEIAKNYEGVGATAFNVERARPDVRRFADGVFTEAFRRDALGATFETSALSIAMQLESNAVAFFTEAARNASVAEVRGFYDGLAAWEREHLDAVRGLYDLVRADFFERSGFEPF